MSIINNQDGVEKERRTGNDRRVLLDQRKNIRFDDKGGDRRSAEGRRSYDYRFEVLNE